MGGFNAPNALRSALTLINVLPQKLIYEFLFRSELTDTPKHITRTHTIFFWKSQDLGENGAFLALANVCLKWQQKSLSK